MNIYDPSTERTTERVLTTRSPRALVIDDDRYVLSLLGLTVDDPARRARQGYIYL